MREPTRINEVEDGQLLHEKMEETKHVTYNLGQTVKLEDCQLASKL